jgi:archaeal chaperonin
VWSFRLGLTTLASLGALIERAEELIGKDVHPTIIVDGYRKSALKAIEILSSMGIKVKENETEFLAKVAKTSLQTKLVSKELDLFAKITVEAISRIKKNWPPIDIKMSESAKIAQSIDLDDIKVEKKAGGLLHDTKLIKGIVLASGMLYYYL